MYTSEVMPSKLAQALSQAEALSPEEQLVLVTHLLGNITASPADSSNLSEFAGLLKLSVDPLEFQKSIRSEWP